MSFDLIEMVIERDELSLNPFRAGRCLSTEIQQKIAQKMKGSQSLSSRAMSFDKIL